MDLKIKDVAELLNVSEKTIRRWLGEGKIPAYRLHHQYRFSRVEIENWMVRRRLKSEENASFTPKQSQLPKEKENPAVRRGIYQFNLYRAIHYGGVFTDVKGKTKEELIRNTMDVVAERLGLDADLVSELLLDREKLMPTALSNGVAVPHTRDFLLNFPFDMIVLVYPEEPIEYGALDGQPVHSLFFLFSMSDKTHLHLLAKLAYLSADSQALEMLKTKPDKKKFLEYLRAWEVNVRPPQEATV